MVTDLHVPISEFPRAIQWANGTDEYDTIVEFTWWHATTTTHGGRTDAPVVVSSSKGQVYVFNTKDQLVGAVEKQVEGVGPTVPEFWPLRVEANTDLWPFAQVLRPARCVLARVDGILGITDGPGRSTWGRPWRIAYACLLLDYFPPLGLLLPATVETFRIGQQEVGDRPARRVKRTVLARLTRERQALRNRAREIERLWR